MSCLSFPIKWVGGWRGRCEGFIKSRIHQNTLPIFKGIRNLAWGVIALRNRWNPEQPVRVPVPIISIGNLTLGGSGKTPLCRWVCEKVKWLGFTPAVLTPVREDQDEAREHLSEGWKVYAGRDRVSSARKAVSDGADLLVLDDGFQYQRLMRDLDIVLWDACVRVDPDYPLLRQPLKMLKKASLIVFSKMDLENKTGYERTIQSLERWAGSGKVMAGFAYAVRERWEGMRLLGVTSVNDPYYFARTLQKTGCRIVGILAFPDHYPFKAKDVERIQEEATRVRADGVAVTKKDIVKLGSIWFGALPLRLVTIDLKWVFGQKDFEDVIVTICRMARQRK
ncbi:MAG: tetraacyldisaccharide 4'-kinase [Armatimonadetes bacterium]|nr:tetraacyldisaccharide 4'-kinase [Armatimonadota bacterium]MDW8123071.1 tetraacyldisaccharide 4'-kinase [Armatimonadota bacterium]